MEAPDWAAYNDAATGRRARPLCRELIERAGPGGGRTALDLGCGAGVEARALLAAGWTVHAVDADPGTPGRVGRPLAGGPGEDRLTVTVSRLEDLDVLPPADLVHASYSLPYVPPEAFPQVWSRLRACLRPGAWLAVDLFGPRDTWAGPDGVPGLTVVDLARARDLLDGLEVLRLDEVEEDGTSSVGTKHWHRFEVVARRPPADRA